MELELTPETREVMIAKAIAKYGPVDERIAELLEMAKSVPATLALDDKNGYLLAQEVRMSCVRARAALEKTRELLKADALEFGRKVDGAAKGWRERIEAIEKPIQALQNAVDARKAELAREAQEAAARAAKARLDARVEAVLKYGPLGVPVSVVETMTDEQFAAALEATRQAFEENKAAKAKLEAERTAREQAEALHRQQVEAAEREARRIEDARRQEERQAQLALEKVQRAERDRLNAERAQLDRERAELEAEKSKKAKAKAAKEAAAAEAARVAALAPDVEKVDAYIDAVLAVPIPLVFCSSGIEAAREAMLNTVCELVEKARK